MSEYYIGQIMLTGFGFAQRGFALCNGQLMAVNQNQALFSLLGVQYGGDGRTTFALPDLRGRVPVGSGASADPAWQPAPYTQGALGGAENVTVLTPQLPAHTHGLIGTSTTGGARSPVGNLLGASSGEALYGPSTGAQVALAQQNLGASGGDQPHANMQPYRTISFAIALGGIFPSRN
ncbi:microcystin-dependent protein [Frateuria sp. Soil773]|uniref:phage tail protein n=1 Tax=Frateuria sp. Soil773 TaxID=1736407 RepID=UPI0006FC367C|nr:tail fiber protein [Frateuria sp. Soil773]KRF00546.1 microcystin-dependent protein [Frateuria sp. Soil773]